MSLCRKERTIAGKHRHFEPLQEEDPKQKEEIKEHNKEVNISSLKCHVSQVTGIKLIYCGRDDDINKSGLVPSSLNSDLLT